MVVDGADGDVMLILPIEGVVEVLWGVLATVSDGDGPVFCVAASAVAVGYIAPNAITEIKNSAIMRCLILKIYLNTAVTPRYSKCMIFPFTPYFWFNYMCVSKCLANSFLKIY